ncbi:tRNA (adenine22-N1)-methyltransferase [Deinococcus reticulitermitis]|uniref:tRNA (Adenine22-N1)-methyltransferase n=1 Tax=Deinococcus reticulitermitis TaxID=856736 RepID=A0A1H7BM89_9DEIO|nr:tRNA (adenine(22)-N(1))-methyltransferase TrmK [Deinococcus reticulitermitis]SEJ75350.1 tRNA (adenine22-N1)-methyltransferase [Deinococcus reticulitermitis]
MTLPALDARLLAVLELIQAEAHADIGTDHARLPVRVIREGRARRCVAVELHPGPLALARRMVARVRLEESIEVRAGDGFAPLRPGEVDSASVAGMGAYTIQGILERAGAALPPALILQPNDSPRALRVWAREHGYHLRAERLCPGHWAYPVLRLERAPGPDPAYVGLPEAAALRYGPRLLRGGSELLRGVVQADLTRLTPVAAPGRESHTELGAAREAAEYLAGERSTTPLSAAPPSGAR